MSLLSRLSLVTGGGSGIGRAVCQLLAREGASVAVAGDHLSSVQETVQSLEDIAKRHDHGGSRFRGYEVDVSSLEKVKAMVEGISKEFAHGPPLSVAVNGAGITRDSLLVYQSEEEFDEVIRVNLKGAFVVSQVVSKYMIQNRVKNGSIINVASIAGKIGNIGQANYSASKGGVMSLTLTCAKELGRYGIRCNAVVPGFIDTQMTESLPPKVINSVVQMTPLGRTGRPEEVAELCVFLASEKSSFITGSLIEITGGLGM